MKNKVILPIIILGLVILTLGFVSQTELSHHNLIKNNINGNWKAYEENSLHFKSYNVTAKSIKFGKIISSKGNALGIDSNYEEDGFTSVENKITGGNILHIYGELKRGTYVESWGDNLITAKVRLPRGDIIIDYSIFISDYYGNTCETSVILGINNKILKKIKGCPINQGNNRPGYINKEIGKLNIKLNKSMDVTFFILNTANVRNSISEGTMNIDFEKFIEPTVESVIEPINNIAETVDIIDANNTQIDNVPYYNQEVEKINYLNYIFYIIISIIILIIILKTRKNKKK